MLTRTLIFVLSFAVIPNAISFQGAAVLNDFQNKKSTSLHSVVLTPVVTALGTACKTFPYATSGIICGFKASSADFIAQKRQHHLRVVEENEYKTAKDNIAVEKRLSKIDLRQNIAFMMYGALYQGIAQECIYNRLYPILFGFSSDIKTVLLKVAFDLLIQTTFITLPIAYMSKAMIYGYGFREACRRYLDDIKKQGVLKKYFLLWGPVQCLTFSIVPEHLRISFIASVSFFWIFILSSITSKTQVYEEE